MIVHSSHRSFALAERKRRRLERSTGLTWEIIARRTRRGRFSSRGRQFTFESKKKRGARFEIFYRGKTKGFSITMSVQLQKGESLRTEEGKDRLLTRLLPLFEAGEFNGETGQDDLTWVPSVPVEIRQIERRNDAPEKPEIEDFSRNS